MQDFLISSGFVKKIGYDGRALLALKREVLLTRHLSFNTYYFY